MLAQIARASLQFSDSVFSIDLQALDSEKKRQARLDCNGPHVWRKEQNRDGKTILQN